MKTLIHASVGILASGLFTAAVFAGPRPQYWNKSAPKPVEKPALVKMEEYSSGKCDGCKKAPVWVVGNRVPAGKGVGLRVAGYSHSCTGCTGAITTENGKTKNDMKHAAGCATLVCCK